MAPPRRYQSPLEQLSELMREARADGLTFDEAWDCAIRPGRSIVMSNTAGHHRRAVRWPTDRSDRLQWQAAINDTREAWQRAYERLPSTTRDVAVATLADAFGALDTVARERALGEGMADVPAVASAA